MTGPQDRGTEENDSPQGDTGTLANLHLLGPSQRSRSHRGKIADNVTAKIT